MYSDDSKYIRNILDFEITQRSEEGCDVSETKRLLNEGESPERLLEMLENLTVADDFPFEESEDSKEILAQCAPKLGFCADKIAFDKFLGAWNGRCIGCALGKPFECSPFGSGKDSIPGWKYIYDWYALAGEYPIKNYPSEKSPAAEKYSIELCGGSEPSFRENIKYMQSDDDIRYMVLALIVLEKYGFDFTSWDVLKTWLDFLPANAVFTAERQAYFNAIYAFDRLGRNDESLRFVSRRLNPFREWIGAQIRVDVYGYACAGNPKKAAELAMRDAAVSHAKNGMYGAMFCAGMISSAFCLDNPLDAVNAGLGCVPKKSRLYAAVSDAAEAALSAKDEFEICEFIQKNFGHYHTVHTINNAAMCAAALVFANGDFEKAVTTAVLGGMDTDCNGATVGSAAGAMCGYENIPDRWKKPLNDTLYSSIADFHPIKISECAERTYKIYTDGRNL